MNTVRTTITLREDVYDNLRRLAAVRRVSVSDVVNAKLLGRDDALTTLQIQTKIKQGREYLASLASKGQKGVDVVASVREMRDE